jgi:nitrogen fixation protein NifU and related proteins
MTDFQFLYAVPWKSALAGAVLIFLLIGGWTWLQLKTDPERGTIDSPDASAFVRGKCGDAMKISLNFSRDRVVEAKYWTDGCRMSSACGAAAAKLALHKTPEEIADIDHVAIEKEVGALPEEDLHCATLAAGALQEAIRLYLVGDADNEKADASVRSMRRGSFDKDQRDDSNQCV